MASETNSSSSAPSASLTSSSIPAFATVTVQNIAGMVPIKLQAGNYLLWKNLFLPVLRKYKLLGLLTGADLRPSKTIVNDAGCIVDNPAFDLWYDKDQSLMIWIISTLSTDLLSQTVGIEYSRDLWEMLEKCFAGVSRANVHHLRQRLQNLVKGDLSMVSYLQQMKEIADGLGDAGHPLTDDDLVAYILAGLSEEYDSFVTSIETRREEVSSDELHGYLLGREAALLKRKLRSFPLDLRNRFMLMPPLLVLHSTFLAHVVPTTLTLSIEVFLPLVVCFRHRPPILPQIFLLLHNLVRKGFTAPIFLEIQALGVVIPIQEVLLHSILLVFLLALFLCVSSATRKVMPLTLVANWAVCLMLLAVLHLLDHLLAIMLIHSLLLPLLLGLLTLALLLM